MAFIIAAIARCTDRFLDAQAAARVRRAERAIARSLEPLGGEAVGPAVKRRLVADYLANRPLAVHSSELASAARTGRP